ncbi:MAG TPA: FAD-binding protein [Thermomicrobiales bacterium]|nr:FAD-binding protein [Thermomicrobiales bacterium]
MSESEHATNSAGGMSRRRLLRTAGIGTALAVGTPLLASAQSATPAASPIASPVVSTRPPTSWDQEADVVVVGSGAAAFAAATTARQAGRDVLMLERAGGMGGTTLISGSEYWIPNNSFMQAKGLTDPRDDALKYMVRLSYPQMYDPESPTLGAPQLGYDLIATYYDTGSVMVDTFQKWGALISRIQPSFGYSEKPDLADPDYHADLPEDKAPFGRGLNPDPDKGGSGSVPVQMQKWTDKNGIPLQVNHRVIGVFQNSAGQVIGVQAETDKGLVAIHARRAVVFGSGGFTQNPTLSLNYLRGPIFGGCGVSTNTGDFVDIGLGLGAQFGNMNHAFWVELPLELALKSSSLPGTDVWIPYGDSMVIVNKYGDRVSSEKMVYNERTQSHFYWDAPHTEYRNLVLFMIYDDAVAQNPTNWPFRYPIPMAGKDADYVIKGNTWDELATNINARLDSVRGQGSINSRIGPDVKLADNFVDRFGATLQRFDSFAQQGVDEDFGRGSTPIQVAWSGPAREGNTKNPTMYPFATNGPYYCIMLGGGSLDTNGGPVINTKSQVLHVTGNPIPGLYGAGNCIASPAGQAYWSGGGTIGPALTYGFIAGQNAANEPEKPVDLRT